MEKNSRKTYDFPKGWCETDLISIASKITDGSHNPPQKQPSGFPMLSARNIQNNEIIFEDIRYIDDDSFLKEYARANVEEGDILLTIVGTIGRSAVVKKGTKRFTLQRSVALVKPLLVDSRFLSYSFQEPFFQRTLLKNAKGTAQKGVYLKTLSSLKIFLPPLPEQHRIVAKIEELFSELDQGIESLKTAQQQLKIYRQAVLKWAFEGKLTAEWREQQRKAGTLESAETLLKTIKQERKNRYQQQLEEWKEEVKAWEAKGKEGKKLTQPKKFKNIPDLKLEQTSALPTLPQGWFYTYLAYVGELGRGKSKHRPRDDSKLFGGMYPFIQTGEVKAAKGFLKIYERTYNDFGLSQSKLWEKGTLCITIAANIADTCFLGIDACFPDSIVGFTAFENIVNAHYVDYFIQSTKDKIEAFAPATAQKNINLTTLENLVVPFCSLAEQHQIVQEIESRFSICDQLEATIQDNLEKAEALRQSILKRAFEGNLVPQDPNDEPAEKLLERIRQEKATRKKPTQQLELEIQ